MVKYALEEIVKKNIPIQSRLNISTNRNSGIKQKSPYKSDENNAFKMDARNHLTNKQKFKGLNDTKKKNLIITTINDLTETRERRFPKIIKSVILNKNDDHYVHTKGDNTLVTIKNKNLNQSNKTQETLTIHKNVKLYNNDVILEDEDNDHLISKNNVKKTKNDDKMQISIKKINHEESHVDMMDVDEAQTNDSIQGYRLIISNLHENVSEDDIMELFSEIGPIKRAHLNKKGVADVVYVHLNHAQKAIEQYNNCDLDGKPLKIDLVTKIPISEKLKLQKPTKQTTKPAEASFQIQPNQSPPLNHSSTQELQKPITARLSNILQMPQRELFKKNSETQFHAPEDVSKPTNSILSKTFSINKKLETKSNLPSSTNVQQPKVTVDTSIIHQALFNNTNSVQNTNSVTFTVKI